ncbi:TPA: hypothetical protein ACH3X1_015432 [Trebouxia sp. C0004]
MLMAFGAEALHNGQFVQVVINFTMYTEFPTSCSSFYAALKHTFAMFACNHSPAWQQISAHLYMHHGRWHQQHCMAESSVNSVVTVDPITMHRQHCDCRQTVASTQMSLLFTVQQHSTP